MQIFVNGRFLAHKITGVQRYAHEITNRIRGNSLVCQPSTKLRGWRGHLWEQSVLPVLSRRGLLWSPCAAGPISASKHIVTFHDLFPLDHPEWYSKAYSSWQKFLMRGLTKSARGLIAVSEYTKQRLIDRFHVSPDKITVIYNGVSKRFFFEESAKSSPPAGLPTQHYLLCVGSLEPRKNLRRLLIAWSDVLPELPPALWLVVVGSGDPAVFKDALADSLPARVFLTGYVSDEQLVSFYSGSTGFVYPSLGEGFGLPPLEAMACGVPVLTSPVTSLPEVCSSAVLYADPTDTRELARNIKLLATDQSLQRRLSMLGAARARLFTWDETARKTLTILENFAHSGGAL